VLGLHACYQRGAVKQRGQANPETWGTGQDTTPGVTDSTSVCWSWEHFEAQ